MSGRSTTGGPRPERAPDPGPATGAWNPFEFDDEDDEDGPETVVGAADARRRNPARTPRRDAFPTLLDGPATALDLGRRPSGPVSPDTAGRSRPGDGSATQVDVAALRRGDGPATDLDVTGRPGRGDGPATDVTGRRGDGPATDFDVTSFDVTGRPGTRGPDAPAEASGGRAALLRPSLRFRIARPAAAGCGRLPRARLPRARPFAPGAAAPAPPRVRPFARNVVDGPTELTDSRLDELEQLDDRTDVAPPRRAAAPTRDAPDDVDDELFGVAGLAGDGLRDGAAAGSTWTTSTRTSTRTTARTTATAPPSRTATTTSSTTTGRTTTTGTTWVPPAPPRPGRGSSPSGSPALWPARSCGCCSATCGGSFRSWRSRPPCSSPPGSSCWSASSCTTWTGAPPASPSSVGLLLTASPAVLVLLGR